MILSGSVLIRGAPAVVYRITTVAGPGDSRGESFGQEGFALRVAVGDPPLAIDASGNLYLAGGDADLLNNFIMKMDHGMLSRFAGTGTSGFSGDGGPATKAQLRSPWDIVMDAMGNICFSDGDNWVIRKLERQ